MSRLRRQLGTRSIWDQVPVGSPSGNGGTVNRTTITPEDGPKPLKHNDTIKFGYEDKYEYTFFVGQRSEAIGEDIADIIETKESVEPADNEKLKQEISVLKVSIKIIRVEIIIYKYLFIFCVFPGATERNKSQRRRLY